MMLADCDLRKLDLSLMDFTDAYFLRCNFERANLRGAVFRDAILTGSNFDETDLTGAIQLERTAAIDIASGPHPVLGIVDGFFAEMLAADGRDRKSVV